jgi:hypothetical protein
VGGLRRRRGAARRACAGRAGPAGVPGPPGFRPRRHRPRGQRPRRLVEPARGPRRRSASGAARGRRTGFPAVGVRDDVLGGAGRRADRADPRGRRRLPPRRGPPGFRGTPPPRPAVHGLDPGARRRGRPDRRDRGLADHPRRGRPRGPGDLGRGRRALRRRGTRPRLPPRSASARGVQLRADRPRPPLPADAPRPRGRRARPARPVRARWTHGAVAGRVLAGGRVLHLPRHRGRRRPVRGVHRVRPRVPRGPRRQLGDRRRRGLRRRGPPARRRRARTGRSGGHPGRQRRRFHRPRGVDRDRRVLRRDLLLRGGGPAGAGRRDPRLRVPLPRLPGRSAAAGRGGVRRAGAAVPRRRPVLRAQAEAFADALARKGLPHALLVFPGEQHGFRRAENVVASLEAELSFYGQVWGFTPPGVPRLRLR